MEEVMGNGANPHQITRHHVFPKSRGGESGSNIVRLPREFHERWHNLFGNLSPGEVRQFIELVFYNDKRKWTAEELLHLQISLQSEDAKKRKKTRRRHGQGKTPYVDIRLSD
jgi:hypothetical protein